MKDKIRSSAAHTWCNPLPIPSIPRGKDEWYRLEPEMFSHENKPARDTYPDYRSISDPTVFYHDGKWYLYPSYGMAWVSEDFCTWHHHRTEPYCPKYSPSIVPWKGKFLLTSWKCPLYLADTPLGPFEKLGDLIRPDGSTFTPCDPGIFADDDGRLYLYTAERWAREDGAGKEMLIAGYELDRDNPRQIVRGPVRILTLDAENHPWERMGRHNQDSTFGWVEGPHLLRHNGRYYMIYAAPDTRMANYAMAVYYSDESPLDGFQCQRRNPLTVHTEGIVSGAGHGCVERGPNGTLWAFYTIATPYTHHYERRIGMDLVDVDENGELYCPFGVTDTPQFAPGYVKDPTLNGNTPALLSLTGGIRPTASSASIGRDPLYATDEHNITWWQPAADDEAPWIECDLEAAYRVSAVRLFWRDVGLDYAKGITPKPIGFILEGCRKGEWFTLLDASDNTEERNIDYRIFDDAICDRVRLRITSWNRDMAVGLCDFTVFGVLGERTIC